MPVGECGGTWPIQRGRGGGGVAGGTGGSGAVKNGGCVPVPPPPLPLRKAFPHFPPDPVIIPHCPPMFPHPHPHPPPRQNTFGPTEGQNEQRREANRRRQRHTIRNRGLVPTPPPIAPPCSLSPFPHPPPPPRSPPSLSLAPHVPKAPGAVRWGAVADRAEALRRAQSECRRMGHWTPGHWGGVASAPPGPWREAPHRPPPPPPRAPAEWAPGAAQRMAFAEGALHGADGGLPPRRRTSQLVVWYGLRRPTGDPRSRGRGGGGGGGLRVTEERQHRVLGHGLWVSFVLPFKEAVLTSAMPPPPQRDVSDRPYTAGGEGSPPPS